MSLLQVNQIDKVGGETPISVSNIIDTNKLRSTIERLSSEAGLTLVDGSFEEGASVTLKTEVIWQQATGKVFAWFQDGVKTVGSGSTPETTGGVGVGAWVDRTEETLKYDLAAENSDVIISEVRAGDMAAAYKNTPSNVISLSRMFDAVDGSDITSILSSAIAYSKLNGFIPIVIDLKSAVISGPLPQLNSSFDFVSLHGLGKRKTNISIGTAGDDVFTLSGGSGGSGGVVLSGLTLIGGATQKPLKNTGFCGARLRDVYIDCGTAVVLSNNIATGTFTEFFLFDSCELNVNSIFELGTGAGNDSFHGCGLTNRCIVNEKSTSTGLIKVGAAGDTHHTVWYNAPLDVHIFKRTAYPIIATQNSLSNVITTSGNVTIENFTELPQNFSDVGSNSRHQHAGTFIGFNGDVYAGSCVFSNLFSTYPSGVVGNGIADSAMTRKITTTTSLSTGVYDKSGNGRMVSVSISAGNYEYCLLVFFAGRVSHYINPSAVIVSTSRNFDIVGFNKFGL